MPMSARELYASYQRGEITDLPAAVEEHMPAWQADHEARLQERERMSPRGIVWGLVLAVFGFWLPLIGLVAWLANR